MKIEAEVARYFNQWMDEEANALGRDQKRELSGRLALYVVKRSEGRMTAAPIARLLQPHFARIGLPDSYPTLFRRVKDALRQYHATIDPTELAESRAAIALDAREASQKLYALFTEMLPEPAEARATWTSGSEEDVTRLEKRLRSCVLVVGQALALDKQVAALYGLESTVPLQHALMRPEQHAMAVKTIGNVIKLLPDEHRAQLRQELEAINVTSEKQNLILISGES